MWGPDFADDPILTGLDDEYDGLSVTTASADDARRFSVADDGIGIEERHRERVFEVFKRLHGTQKHSGTGIGLAVRQEIVERHDGRIRVDSEPGEGSTFHFAIPVTDTDHT